MRSLLSFMIVFVVTLLGCRSAEKKETAKKTGSRTVTSRIVDQKASVRPVDAVHGRVIAVRNDLRFVVIDFANSRLPKLDQRLSLYRLDQKVAEVRVSGPYLGTTVAADVTEGSATEGDLARDQ
jgi:hypothetical protein